MARLVIFDEILRAVDLPERAVVVGRSRRTDVPIRDTLLSRKHFSIVPSRTGYTLVDLNSQNGTFVNGERVDRAELTYDDIIEVGHTVAVLLDTETWQRGEGLPRLRNPLKAQELIQRLSTMGHNGANGSDVEPLPVESVGAGEPGVSDGAGGPADSPSASVELESPGEDVGANAREVLSRVPPVARAVARDVRRGPVARTTLLGITGDRSRDRPMGGERAGSPAGCEFATDLDLCSSSGRDREPSRGDRRPSIESERPSSARRRGARRVHTRGYDVGG